MKTNYRKIMEKEMKAALMLLVFLILTYFMLINLYPEDVYPTIPQSYLTDTRMIFFE